MKTAIKAAALLIATSAPAAADVAFSGYGRFGVAYDESTPDRLRTTSRLRINFDVSTEADNGLTFGARLRLQADNGALPGMNGARLFAATKGFDLQVGNIAGAIDDMPGFYGFEPGLTDLTGQYAALRADFDEYSSTGPGRDGVRLSYTGNNLNLIVSHSNTAGIRRTALSLGRDFGNVSVALGYQTSNNPFDDRLLVATVSGSTRNADYVLFLADEAAGFVYGGSLEIALGAETDLQVSISQNPMAEYYGLGLMHKLGNGVSLRGGIARNAGNSVADLGLRFNF